MDCARRNHVRAAVAALSLFASVYAQPAHPGQPSTNQAPLGGFKIAGNTLVSAQQLFLGTLDKVYVVDKVENNPTQINGHPAWASEYSISTDKARPMDIVTNSFCAGGTVLGNGTWLNVGGNQAVKEGGETAESQTGGGIYDDPDGGKSLLDPCDDGKCEWRLATDMEVRRWYPTLETLEDGRALIAGGCQFGGYVNNVEQDTPNWEIFPAQNGEGIVHSDTLANTLPVNLFPILFMLPSGKIFMNSDYKTVLLDYKAKTETPLDDMKDAMRLYPASGTSAMLPLTPDNDYTATLLFCGGNDLKADQWTTNWNIAAYNASASCVRITPDKSKSYEDDDPLPEGRTMGNHILLPDGKSVVLNGAQTGTAGYGKEEWTIQESYADSPLQMPIIYDPSQPKGKRWSRDGLHPSTIPRMYHSTATLLPDGSVFVSGSNPHADYTVENTKYPTEYRVEYFYPSYYNKRRPEPVGLPPSLSYGGAYFNVTLAKDDLSGDMNNLKNTKVVVIRTGFSTHALNMGQRMLQLRSTYTGNSDGTATLHVSQMPPNAATFAPGPALLFVVVNGVPSIATQVMIGTGDLGEQPTAEDSTLPEAKILTGSSNSNDNSDGNNNSARGLHGSGSSLLTGLLSLALLLSLL